MNEIPRRSFLALLGAAVVAAKLPSVVDAVEAAPAVEIKNDPITFVRRWYVTGIELSNAPGEQFSARVRLTEVFFTEGDSVRFRPSTVDLREIISASTDRKIDSVMTLDGVMETFPRPATAEIELGLNEAMKLQRKVMAGADLVEFVGGAPI
jgi:hypothetical protein